MNAGTSVAPAFSPDPAELAATLRAPERLRALRRTDLVGSGPDQAYDRLTRLAAALLHVPAVFIALVDAEGNFYKSSVGLDDRLAPDRRISGPSFCQYAIQGSRPLVIEDTATDARVGALAAAQTLGARAYAGVPLIVDGRHAIGSFCAIDFAPRAWSTLDLDVLRELARAATREIELRMAMNDAVAALELTQQTLRERDEAISHLAHDLRSPLSAISISAVGLGRRPEPEIKNYAGIQTRATKQMSQLIEDMRVTNSDLPLPHPQSRLAVHCEALLQDVVHAMGASAEARGLLLVKESALGLPAVVINYPQIMRVFANLVGNAIQYSPAGTVVTLSCELESAAPQADETGAGEQAGGEGKARSGETGETKPEQMGEHAGEGDAGGLPGYVRFAITDQGPGIPEEYHDRVFDRHWQVERGLSKGYGLGLAVSRIFVEANGGRIGIEHGNGPKPPPAPEVEPMLSLESIAASADDGTPQAPGVGARLYFTLPVARATMGD